MERDRAVPILKSRIRTLQLSMRVYPFLTELEKLNKDQVYTLCGGNSTLQLVDWGTKVLILLPDGNREVIKLGVPKA